MGAIFSRWRKKESAKEILEAIEQDIEYVETRQHINEQLRKRYIGLLLVYSVIIYVVAALVFYFKYFPSTWKDRVIRTLPLLVFPLVVYGVKRLLHYMFVSRMAKYALKLEELKEKKKKVLQEVMEKETYKTAKEILDKYDPKSEIFKDEKREADYGVQSQPQSPVGMELRQRKNIAAGPESPCGPLPRTPSGVSEKPVQAIPLDRASPRPTPSNSPAPPGMANRMTQDYRPPPGPPKPTFPVPPRDRSSLDKVVEYLIGDGPSNRYALICQKCWSHNGMALKEEFEYIAFRCCYCYHPNPARRQRPTAPKLEDDIMTPGRARKHPPASPKGTSKQNLPKSTEDVQELMRSFHKVPDIDKAKNDLNGDRDEVTKSFNKIDEVPVKEAKSGPLLKAKQPGQ